MMNRLNRQIEYGLMALKVLASKKPGEKTTAKEVAEKTGSPFDPTARVLQQMKQKGLVHGEQGVQGGYLLLKDLSKISFHDFSESLLGSTAVARCLHSKTECELRGSCNIVSPMNNLNRKLEEFYKSLSLKDLLFSESESSSSGVAS